MFEPISRRTILKGLGATVALPWLEAMAPVFSSAAPALKSAPKRMAFFYVPNGIHMQDWTPKEVGPLTELPATLEPLAAVKDYVNVMTGLTCDKARPNGDGPGDHARAMSAFLTGCQAKKTSGADIKVGQSADQIAADRIGHETKFSSLEIGCEGGRNAGNCDSGYSCAYSSNLSWRTEATPMSKETDPRQVFERLFGNGPKGERETNRAKRNQYNKSILDSVMEDAKDLRSKLGATDQRKMDEYLVGIREIELRIARSEKMANETVTAPNYTKPSGIPKEYDEHLRLLSDMLVLAFQGDLTRIATYVFANDGSNRSYKLIGVPEGHHDCSHHGGDKEKHAKLKKINRFHIENFAYLLKKLKETREGNGNLLDSCMMVYGSGIGDGNRHNHDDLPILLVGKGGGTIQAGRHLKYPRETPLTNLYVSMLDRLGVPVEKVGDSKGKLENLA